MYVNVHSHVRIIIVDQIFAVITKYTVLDEQRREAKEGKSQRKNPRSITRGLIQHIPELDIIYFIFLNDYHMKTEMYLKYNIMLFLVFSL